MARGSRRYGIIDGMATKHIFRVAHGLRALAIVAGASLAAHAAYAEGPAQEDGDYEFLVRYMPSKDRGVVSEKYLRANVRLAQETRRTAPWRDTISDETFREYVLPYSSIGEEVDDWRPLFREKFWPLVKDCKTTGEAVQLINSKICGILDVRYNVKRDKPDQSPFHSMRIHMASCTGLAILQIDAYRACGIPARFTGCNWTTMPGNHSWVEYYDAGKWHFFNDPEDGKIAPPDNAWFTPYAAQADETSPRTRIYAARWSYRGTRFWKTWGKPDAPSAVPADDVTASYRRFRAGVPSASVAFVARDASGTRRPVEFRLVAPGTGKVMAAGTTFDESHDMNDHFVVSLPEGTKAIAVVKSVNGEWEAIGIAEFKPGQSLFKIKAP